jgi:hypothetical protein
LNVSENRIKPQNRTIFLKKRQKTAQCTARTIKNALKLCGFESALKNRIPHNLKSLPQPQLWLRAHEQSRNQSKKGVKP